MAQTNFTPISLYYSTTAAAVPTAGNLVAGELAINTQDGKLFYKDAAGVVQTIASKDTNSGTFTNISVSGVASFADGTVSLPSITNIGDTNTGIYFPAADTIAFTEGGVESMRIDSSGNALVNQTASYSTQVGTSSGWTPKIQVSQTSTSNIGLGVYSWSNYSAADLGGGIGLSDFVISHSNNNTVGSHTAVSNGMVLGRISLNGSDGTNFVCGAFISAAADGQTWATNDCPARLVFGTTADGSATPTERMRITSAGNVGIGTSSPSQKLEVSGTTSLTSIKTTATTAVSTFQATNTSGTFYLGIENSTGTFFGSANSRVLYADGAYPMNFYTNSVERMRIDSSGNVGIGTTSPTQKLTVQGLISTKDSSGTDIVQIGDIGSTLRLQGRTSLPMTFWISDVERMRIDSSGNFFVAKSTYSDTSGDGFGVFPNSNIPQVSCVGAANSTQKNFTVYSSTDSGYKFFVTYAGVVNAVTTTISGISDQRLKENIVDLDVGLNAVMALKPRKFDWKEGKGANTKNARGFIAQEFETVFPDLIDEWADPAPKGELPYKSVRADLIPVLVKAMQEQQTLIENLTTRLNALEGK